MDSIALLKARGSCNLVDIDMRDLCIIAVEDLGNFLERGTARLDVEEADEDELKGDPDLDIHVLGLGCMSKM